MSKTKICDWCDERKTIDDSSNTCRICLSISLKKIGWSDRDIKISEWGTKTGRRSFRDFSSLTFTEQQEILND